MKKNKPWLDSMPEDQFQLMRKILSAPSPIGYEAALTHGVIEPYIKSFAPKDWKFYHFKGNAGLVVDTNPDKMLDLSVMIVGHADKIRMQVRNIGSDGKIWVDSDSFLPSVLIGHEVSLFSKHPDSDEYNIIGGTIEAVGAIHFADADLRSGEKGINKNQLYLELQINGEKPVEKIKNIGIKPGDPIILNRPIKRGFSENTFYGAYLDNGLGCFIVAELARKLSLHADLGIGIQFAFAPYEEIGRFGSRVLAREFSPDVLISIDVAHDYDAAPGISNKRMTPASIGKGFSLDLGSITSSYMNDFIIKVADKNKIPYQIMSSGHDTGTDAMAPVLAGIDAAAVSIGIPVRNMHTISEIGHTSDIISALCVIEKTILEMNNKNITRDDFMKNHLRLDTAEKIN